MIYSQATTEQLLAADSLPATFSSLVVAWGKEPLKSGVRLLSLMNVRNLLLSIVIACSLVTVVTAQRQRNRRAVALVDTSKPVVFISYLRSAELEPLRTGYGRKHLLFRITNNSRWAMWLNMSGVPKAYGDAGLFYTIENKEDGKIQIDARCHVCSVNPVGAGRSVVFSIPADYASQDARMLIEYSFAWERGNETEGGSYSTHSVLFYFSYLPKSALPAAAQSNNGMHPTSLSLPLINLASYDVGSVLSSGGGRCRALETA